MANSELSWMERNNLTPGKIGLIGTLVLVFVGVVAYQLAPLVFRGGPVPPPESASQPTPRQPVAQTKTTEKNNRQIPPPPPHLTQVRSSNAVRRTNSAWPKIEIEDAVGFDPFRMPSSLRDSLLRQQQLAAQGSVESTNENEAFDRREALLTKLTEQGVDVVIYDGKNAVAAIGGIELRVGDVIEGLQVKSISRDGIELVRVDPMGRHGEP